LAISKTPADIARVVRKRIGTGERLRPRPPRSRLPPEVLEPVRRQLGVAYRVLDVLVAEPSLERPAAEVERLQAAARKFSRWAHRDATMILLGYRHGLRASELCDLQWSQVELATGRLHVRRAKNGTPSVHPLRGEELRALRRLQRECGPSPYVFQSERGGPMTPKSFHALFGRIGVWAKVPFPIHPHMLRHGCGYALANAGHDTRALQAWLGHKNIQHTVRYTELAPDRFKDFWRD
jgi:integrase